MLPGETGKIGEGMRDSYGSFFSLLGGIEVGQTGPDVVRLWAAEASSLMAHGGWVVKQGKRRRDGGEHNS